MMTVNKNFVFALFVTIFVNEVLRVGFGWNFGVLEALAFFIISYPWKIGGNIYSLWGGVNESGSVFSLVGIFQEASEDTLCILSLCLLQKAGYNAFQLIGFSLKQEAGDGANQGLVISMTQTAERVFQFAGFSVCQKAIREATQLFGVSLYQRGYYIEQCFGISIYQTAGDCASQGIGMSICQRSKRVSEQWLGISLYQEAPMIKNGQWVIDFLKYNPTKKVPA